MDDDGLHDFTDRALRELLSKPDNLREFLREVVPDTADGFDFDRMKPAPREFILGNWRYRSPDLMFEIPFRTSESEVWALVCVMLEHQSNADWLVPLRSYLYGAHYWEWKLRTWEELPAPKTKLLLTPVLPIVLHTGPRPWTNIRTLRETLGPPEAFHQFTPDWQPIFWELATHSFEELLDGPAAFLQALAILKANDSELAEAQRRFQMVMHQIEPLHDKGRVRWQDLLRFLLGWAHYRRPIKERPEWHGLADQLHFDADRLREIRQMGLTIAQGIFQEGWQEGQKEGRQEGKQEGRQEGFLDGALLRARKHLRSAAQPRLGAPAESVSASIEKLSDLDRIDRMIDRIEAAASWEDLLAIP